MLDQKLGTARFEVSVRGESRCALNKAVIGSSRIGVSGGTCIVKSRKDARRSALFDEVAHNLVVEVLDWRPRDLFSDVFLLLSLQRKFDKDLLQLLVNIINT